MRLSWLHWIWHLIGSHFVHNSFIKISPPDGRFRLDVCQVAEKHATLIHDNTHIETKKGPHIKNHSKRAK
jgi:hypothetical protein